MYYARNCSYCSKVFYTYNSNKEHAAKILFRGIKKHLIDYGEDDKEHEFDEYTEREEEQMYYEMKELSAPPSGGYPL